MQYRWFARLITGLVVLSVTPTGWAQQNGFEALADFDYWADLCRLQASAKDYENALVSCEQAIALSPNDPDVWAQHSGILVNMETYPDAIASANQALSLDPEHSLAITYQCVAYTSLGETEMALDKCNNALRVNGNWGAENPALAWFYRGTILAQADQYELALIAYERTLLLEPEDSRTLTRKCEAQVALERPLSAISTCEAAIATDTNWRDVSPALAWTHQGRAYTQLSQYDSAIFAYDQAISIDPTNELTWASQGQVLEALRRNSEALVSYDRAVAIKADYSLALLGQCTIQNRLGNYADALTACTAAIDEGDGQWGDQGLAKGWKERSVALTGSGTYEEALASVNRAVGIQPDYVAAHNHRGAVYWYMGEYPQALAANQRALDLDETYASAWFTRGLIYRAMEQYDNALEAYDEALALNPLSGWGWTNRSLILWLTEDYEESLFSADRAVALEPELASAWLNQGAALSALGRYGDAISSYDQVLLLDETNSEALAGRGVAWVHMKEYETATADLEAALAINPDNILAQETLTALAEAQSATP